MSLSTILYTLAFMWALGTLGLLVWIIFALCESVMQCAITALIGFPIWVLLGLGPAAGVKHEMGPELATLLKSEWHCSASHIQQTTTYIQVGKIMVPSTTDSTVCDQYARGGE